jgi:chromate transporter
LRQFQSLPAVQYAFWGIRAGVVAMLLKSLWTMFKKSPKGWPAYVAMAAAFVMNTILDLHILIVIGSCAVFGLVTATLIGRRAAK